MQINNISPLKKKLLCIVSWLFLFSPPLFMWADKRAIVAVFASSLLFIPSFLGKKFFHFALAFLIFSGVAHLAYFFALRSDLDVFFWGTIYSTNINESLEFFRSYEVSHWLKIVAWLFAAGCSSYFLSINYRSLATRRLKIFAILVLVLFGGWIVERAIREEESKDFIAKVNNIYPLRLVTSGFRHDAMAQDMRIFSDVDPPHDRPKADLIVVVIGESASAMRWSELGYKRNLTNKPLEVVKESIVAKTVVANGNNTAMTMPLLLTGKEMSDFSSSGVATYLDYAKSAGFATLTYSNQNVFGSDENFFHMAFIKRSQNFAKVQDGSLDEKLSEGVQEALRRVNGREPVLLTLHTIGSHPLVSRRYPKHMAVFEDHYDNSIHYTSALLAEWAALLELKKDLRAVMLYISDHGLVTPECGGNYSHGYSRSAFEVPFLIFGNKEFLSQNQAWFDSMKSRSSDVAANRIFFDSILDLLGYGGGAESVDSNIKVLGKSYSEQLPSLQCK